MKHMFYIRLICSLVVTAGPLALAEGEPNGKAPHHFTPPAQCEPIIAACKKADPKARHCMHEILKGEPVEGVTIDPNVVQQCKTAMDARRAEWKAKHEAAEAAKTN